MEEGEEDMRHSKAPLAVDKGQEDRHRAAGTEATAPKVPEEEAAIPLVRVVEEEALHQSVVQQVVVEQKRRLAGFDQQARQREGLDSQSVRT